MRLSMFFHIRKKNLSGVSKNEGQNCSSEFSQCRPFFGTLSAKTWEKNCEDTRWFSQFSFEFCWAEVGFSIVKFFQIQGFPATPNSLIFFNLLQRNYKIPIALKTKIWNFQRLFWIIILPTVFLKGFVFKLTSERLISSWVSSFVHLSFGPAMANPWPFSTLLNIAILQLNRLNFRKSPDSCP